MQDSYLDVNQRASFFQYAYSSAPAMVMRTSGAGSKYPFTLRDADGEFLDGANTYRLHLPPNPPAALFWAVTAYNVTDGTMPRRRSSCPSTNGFYDVAKNADGSIDLWFGPAKPADAPESNCIQTVRRPELPRRVPPLRHRRRVLRPDLEARRRRQGEVTSWRRAARRVALTH